MNRVIPFKQWFGRVTAIMSKKYGVTPKELPYFDYRTEYDNGKSPTYVIELVMKEQGKVG